MLKVGLTGTVGAGKSTVGDLFERWGACRVDADRLAREAVAPGSPALEAIREAFGEAILAEDGSLDRAAMRELAFADPEARRRLEEIVHPEVRRLQRDRAKEARTAGCEVFVAEVPLLFEGGLEEAFDLVVVVDAPREQRRRRVREERGVDAQTFEAIERAQWPPERKRAAADQLVVNDGSLEELEERAGKVWREIERRAGAAA